MKESPTMSFDAQLGKACIQVMKTSTIDWYDDTYV